MTNGSPSQRFEAVALIPTAASLPLDRKRTWRPRKPRTNPMPARRWRSHGTIGPVARSKQQRSRATTRAKRCIAVAFAGPGKPVVLFRNIFDGGIRDHAVITFSGATPGPLYRVSDDNAKIDVCPHQGPSLAIGKDGTYHATWFALGRKLKGLTTRLRGWR